MRYLLIFVLVVSLFADMQKVQDLMAKDRYQDALELLDKLEKKERKNSTRYGYILHTKGIIFYNQNSYKEAKKYLYKSLDLIPDNIINTTIILAHIELYEKDYDKALDLIRKLDKLGDKSANRYLIESQIYIEQNKYKKAYETMKKLIEIDPKVGYKRNLASICIEIKRYDEAESIYKENIVGKERVKSDFLNLFYLYIMQDKHSKAVDILTVANSIEQLDLNSKIIYSRSLMENGVPIRSAKLLQELIDNNSSQKTINNLSLLATSYGLAKEHKKAKEIYFEIYSTTNEQKDLENIINYAYSLLDYKTVSELSKIYIDRGFNDEKILFLLAISLHENNQTNEAKKIFEKLLDSPKYKKDAVRWIRYLEESD